MLENLVSRGGTFPGSQKNRFSSEPIENVKALKTKAMETQNASVKLFAEGGIPYKSTKRKRSKSTKKDI